MLFAASLSVHDDALRCLSDIWRRVVLLLDRRLRWLSVACPTLLGR